MLNACLRLGKAEQSLAARVHTGRRQSARSVLRQIEIERQRLGRELHTGVGQMLAAIRLQSEVVASRLADPEPQVAQALGRMGMLVQDALEQVRSISSVIYPPAWQQASLEEALKHLWALSGIPERFQAELQIAPQTAEPDRDVKILIYRAAQEALSNIARHSRASRVSMTLEHLEGRLVMRVSDDGVGFDASRAFSPASSTSGGIGLRTIRDQAESLGGIISLQSGPHGTTLEVSVPLSR